MKYHNELVSIIKELMFCAKNDGFDFAELRRIAYHGASLAECSSMIHGEAGDMLVTISRAAAEEGDFMRAAYKAVEDKFISYAELEAMEREFIEDTDAKVKLLRLARYKASTGEDVHVVG